MKKLTALALCLTTVFALGTPVSADTLTSTETGSNSSNMQVMGTYVNNQNTKVYSVDIEWSDFNFKYGAGKEWDPAKHKYIQTTEWGDQKGTVKVTNHSNASIKYTLKYDNQYRNFHLSLKENVDSRLVTETGTLISAEGTEVESAPSQDFTLYPWGTLSEETNNVVVGTLTLTIEPDA